MARCPRHRRRGLTDPDVFADKTAGQVADHYSAVIGTLARKPAVIGHSFGGLLAQIVAGRGQAAATVAIDAAPFPRCTSAAAFLSEGGIPGAGLPGEPAPRGSADL